MDTLITAAKISVAPTAEPVTTPEAKAHLRVEHTDEDTYIGSLIKVARQAAEEYTGRQWVDATWKLYLDDWPGSTIYVPHPPLSSVTSVQYYDYNNTLQTMDTANYDVSPNSSPGRICRAYGYTWPSVYERPEAITITYVAGYGEAADVPKSVKQAILLWVAHWYEMREPVITGATVNEVPDTVQRLLHPYRIYGVG